MTTVGELFHSLGRDEVIAAIDRLYPNPPVDYPSYQGAWDIICDKQALTPTDMVCELYRDWSWDEPREPYVGVHGRSIEGEAYAIEFNPWSEWLTMEIKIDPEIGDISQVDTLAHIFWEMTWCGYNDEAIADEKQEIMDRVDEVKELLESEPHSRS